MQITRHFVQVGDRRVHYRRCGGGPALLMVHQSPRSSAEYAVLMREWGRHFTCIAPDTPGFGQSDPLAGDAPDIAAFADAVAALLDALAIDRCAAYGFHSGGIILATALKRHPRRFSCLAIGGYAVWTPAEMALFGAHYLPPFVPQPYGEHLVWLWNRMLEQSWFFPWFAVAPEHRLSVAHDDVARVDAAVREMLDAGDAYRAGYGAVLRAARDIPPADAAVPPVLVTAYDGDPLQDHIDRLGALSAGWAARKVATPAEHHAASLAFLQRHAAGATPALVVAADIGFAQVRTDAFDGLIHWRGGRDGPVRLAAPGSEAALTEAAGGCAIDPPGHGLSDDWAGAAPRDWAAWASVIDAVAAGRTVVRPALPPGDCDRLFPDLAPDRFGSHLTRGWGAVRAAHLFRPWYAATAAAAIAFDPAALAPDRLAREHRALMRARTARDYLTVLRSNEGET